MDNREKTIDAFEKCIKIDDEGELYSDCDHCPYKSEERKLKGEAACESFVDLDVQIPYQLAADMLKLLKEQEPKVLTWEEVEHAEVCWLEEYGWEPYAVLDAWDWNPEEYGKSYRCWSTKPTKEQQEAVKWND